MPRAIWKGTIVAEADCAAPVGGGARIPPDVLSRSVPGGDMGMRRRGVEVAP